MFCRKYSVLVFLMLTGAVWGQESVSNGVLTLSIKKSAAPLRLDGLLDEPAWKEAQLAGSFHQVFPFDTAKATVQTEVWTTFDDAFLYIGAKVYEPREEYIISSLKRDFDAGESDVFIVVLDPFQDKLNGFFFELSPYNVQGEGLIDNGQNVSLDWDNKWYSQVSNHQDHWELEMAIPFKTLRYKLKEGQNTWRINFLRHALKKNEASAWSRVPRQFDPANLAFTGELVWEDNPPQPGMNVSLIPYITARTERDFEFKLPSESSFNAGGDAKIALTPSLNLDLTVNPDFSQVEVDRQITNLSRFELFFPERRQFFLENEDLFSRFGFPDSRPFFSRRIGLANGLVRKTTTDGQLVEVRRNLNVPIRAGMRLSGKLNQNWRIGLLNMQTGKQEDIGLNPANYTVGVVQRTVFDRSVLSGVFVNKENFLEAADGSFSLDKNGYNRAAGLEFNYYSKDNKWESEAYYHRSFSAGQNNDAQSAAWYVGYNTLRWFVMTSNQYVGENFRTDVGFVPRRGNYSFFNMIRHSYFPKDPEVAKKIQSFGFGLETGLTFNTQPAFRLTDRTHEPFFFMNFPGQQELQASIRHEYVYLFFPFDPTNSGGEELPEDTDYAYTTIGISYESDNRKRLFYELSVNTGNYFNGNILQGEAELNYRWQPFGILAVRMNYNKLEFPSPYNSTDFWLIGPRAELSLSRSVFFSTFLQYNTQADNVNVNSRLQWRFRPASDLFLVYTDNYFSDQFFSAPNVKNRALVFKMTYWLNL
ncbi:MAG: hypothetical protein KIPDCIKN_00796 [Haliscomenobacter sp.]|jgi:hypothetical protein|nr:hypothetical protein [Haliscomenobacter sp.]